jgi:hypothetical protein
MKHLILCLLLCGCLQAAAQAPYTITLKKAANQPAPALQSYCIATMGNFWLLIGGRTNGFHGTAGSGSTFPSSASNTSIWVVDMNSNKSWKGDIPASLQYQLSSTNMAYYQDGNTLYIIGGYGAGCANDGCYQTFSQVTAVDVQRVIAAVQNGYGSNNYIKTMNDPRMAVTGGYLVKLNDWFHLVMGQNYTGKYSGGVSGKYTEQIARFKIDNSGSAPAVTNYSVITTNEQYNGANQFHRRDYPSVKMVMPANRNVGVAVFGGVFNNQGGPFINPVYFEDMGFNTLAQIDTNFKQRFCMYDCAAVSAYNSATGEAYVSFIGGITDWYIDDSGNEVPGNASNFMPWFNRVSTIVRSTKGTQEYPQKNVTLPGYIGANAAFILNPAISLIDKSGEVIDYGKLQTGNNLIGWMYGGIEATAPQSNGFNPTSASSTIYEVWLQKN